jgi:hypothetical protein
MRSVWIAGAHRDCLLSAQDAELLLDELARFPPGRYPQAPAAASLIEQALRGAREAPVLTLEAAQTLAVLRALEALLAGRRYFSEGLGDLLDLLLAESHDVLPPDETGTDSL